MAKLSIETLPDAAEGVGSSEISVEGSAPKIMQAWLYLTWALADALKIPAASLLALGQAHMEQIKDSIVETVCIDQGKLKGK